MGAELDGAEDTDGAQLVEAEDREPELVVAAQDQHDTVAALDAERFEVVGALGRGALDLREGEPCLALLAVNVKKRQLVRLRAPQLVHHVEGEVEMLGILEFD